MHQGSERQGSALLSETRRAGSILMVLHSELTSTGGAEMQAVALALSLHNRGWKICLLSLASSQRNAKNGLSLPFATDYLSVPAIRGLAGALLIIRFAIYLVRNQKHYDTIHVHITKTLAFTASIVGPILRKRVLLKISGADQLDRGLLRAPSSQRSIYFRLLNWGCRRATYVVAISRRIEGRLALCGYRSSQIVYLPNGVDVNRFRPISDAKEALRRLGLPDVPVVVAVGRLVSDKALFDLIDAWRLVRKARPECLLYILGDGPYRSALETLVRVDLGLQGAIHFVGQTAEVELYLAAATCYVSSSRSEGLSNTLLEAMACGLAVVVTRVSGAEDVIEDGITGLLVPVGDSTALATALLRVLMDAESASCMGRRAREVAEHHFSISRISERYEELYHRY